MHDKYMIVDNKNVETGSFNYTASAEHRNAENVVVIRNNKKLAKKYTENWQKLWNESEDYKLGMIGIAKFATNHYYH